MRQKVHLIKKFPIYKFKETFPQKWDFEYQGYCPPSPPLPTPPPTPPLPSPPPLLLLLLILYIKVTVLLLLLILFSCLHK